MAVKNRSRRKGCLFYGCLTSIVVVMVGAIALFFVARHALDSAIATYTDSEPRPLPQIEISAAQQEELQRRLEQFQADLEAGRADEPLVLTGEELNVLVATQPGLREWTDHIHLSIEDDQVQGEVSLPLERFSRRLFTGRYLNGTVGLRLTFQNGMLGVFMDSAEVKGEPLPEPFMMRLRGENLAKDLHRNPETAELLRRIETITVRDDQLIIQPRTGLAPAE